MMNDERLDWLLSMKYHPVDYPTLLQVQKAYDLYSGGMVGRYFIIHYWGDAPSGYTQFVFDDSQPLVPDGMPVLIHNPEQTDFDRPDVLMPDEWILCWGVDIPAGKDVYRLPVVDDNVG